MHHRSLNLLDKTLNFSPYESTKKISKFDGMMISLRTFLANFFLGTPFFFWEIVPQEKSF